MVSVFGIVISVIIGLVLKPVLDEIWTILQIIKSFFVTPPDLKSKYGDWAVVTGCTDGIGKGYAFQLAKRGINIVLISRNSAKLSKVAEELTAKHKIETKIIVADFSEGEKIYPVIKEQLKGIEVGILVNNVGTATKYPMFFEETPEKEIGDIIRVNVGTVTYMTHIVLPGMIERKRGAIVNVSSASRIAPLPLSSVYTATKIFTDYFTEGLRTELRKNNITVQELMPFFVSTKIIDFNAALKRSSILVPQPHTYASHAIKTLGVIDNTTGYWPHRIQFGILRVAPVWLLKYIGGTIAQDERNSYLEPTPTRWCLKSGELFMSLLLCRIYRYRPDSTVLSTRV